MSGFGWGVREQTGMEGSDQDLLRRYVDQRDDAAFAEIVRRHAPMVYGAALRQTGDSHQAQEVTQAVFLLLVRKAAGMNGSVVLGAWLFRATQYAANDLRKVLRRRAARETPMESMPELAEVDTDGETAAAWRPYLPHLDRCLARLPEVDRRALWLRFFEDRSLAEVGRALGVAEEAARKRVRRALDRLQEMLEREGARVDAADLGDMLGARQSAVVPAGLVAGTLSAVLQGTASPTAHAVAAGVVREWLWLACKPWAIAAAAMVTVAAGVQAVRTATVVEPARPRPASDDYSVAGFPDPAPVHELVRELQSAILRQDAAAAARWIRFPLRVNGPGGTFLIEGPEALAGRWKEVFTHDVASLVLKSPGSRLYCDSRGVMVGTGELWVNADPGGDGGIRARVSVVNTR